MKFSKYFILILMVSCSLLSYSQSAFYNLGKSYAKEGNYDEAIRLTRQSIPLDSNNSNKYNLLMDYDALCEYFSYMNQSDSCQVYAQKIMELWESVEGVRYSDIIRCLAGYFHRAQNYNQAIIYREDLLKHTIKEYGIDSPKLIKEYRLLSIYSKDAGDFRNAIKYSKLEEELSYKIYGKYDYHQNDLTYTDSFSWLVTVLHDCEDTSLGVQYVTGLLKEHKSTINDDCRTIALNYILAVSKIDGLEDICLSIYKEQTLNGNIQDQLENFINLVAEGKDFSRDVNAYEYAENLYSFATQNELTKWFSNDDITTLLKALTYYYSEVGPALNYYNVARLNYEWCIKNKLDIGLSDIWVLIAGSSIDDATPYIISIAEDILRDHRHDDDLEVIKWVYETLAQSYLKLGNNDKANYYFSIIGDQNDFDVLYARASILCELGNMKGLFPIALKLNDYKNIEPQIRELILSWLMISARDSRKKEILIEYAEEYLAFYRSMILNEVPLMSENEQARFLRTNPKYSHVPFFDFFIGINNKKLDWSATKEAYDYALLSKGVLLTSQNEFRNAIKNSPDSTIQSKWALLQKSNDQFSLQDEIIKRELIKYASQTSSYLRKLSYTWQDVRNALKKDEAAIEFIKCYNFYSLTDSTPSPYYIALVVRSDYDEPKTIVLGSTNFIGELKNDELLDSEDLEIFENLWGPIEPYIRDIKTVYFSPTEELNSIAIEYASMGNNLRLCDTWNLIRLSSTREVVNYTNNHHNRNAVLYGGLKYNLDRDGLIAESRSYPRQSTSTHRAIVSDNLRYGVNDLPGTLEEVTEIYQLFPNKPRLITDISGTEESFKSLAGSKYDIIHLATHGFFWSESDAKKRNYVNFIKAAQLQSSTFEDNAMTRSGLIFSGANIGLMGNELPDDVEDGVLTALELSNMNLGKVDMVVMSACESGLGETSGEGVFGLQRGFKLAGANSLLMSLWKVDDRATKLLMIEFYRNYLSGKSKQQSLKLAQDNLRQSAEYSDPKYWAAFVLLDGLD